MDGVLTHRGGLRMGLPRIFQELVHIREGVGIVYAVSSSMVCGGVLAEDQNCYQRIRMLRIDTGFKYYRKVWALEGRLAPWWLPSWCSTERAQQSMYVFP